MTSFLQWQGCRQPGMLRFFVRWCFIFLDFNFHLAFVLPVLCFRMLINYLVPAVYCNMRPSLTYQCRLCCLGTLHSCCACMLAWGFHLLPFGSISNHHCTTSKLLLFPIKPLVIFCQQSESCTLVKICHTITNHLHTASLERWLQQLSMRRWL